MPQQVIRVRVVLPMQSPLIDTASWGWIMEMFGSSPTGDIQAYTTGVAAAMTTNVNGMTASMASYLSPCIQSATNACWVEATDITDHLDGSPAGAAGFRAYFTVPSKTNAFAWPEGVALATSWRCDYASDPEFEGAHRPRAGDRGRAYVGPLSASQVTGDANSRSTPSPSFINNLLKWWTWVGNGLSATPQINGWGQVVLNAAKAAVYQIIQRWIDDRYDYQRRRSDPDGAARSIAGPSGIIVAARELVSIEEAPISASEAPG